MPRHRRGDRRHRRRLTLEVEEIRTVERLTALSPQWRALWTATPHAGPFQSPAWLLPWARRFAPTALWTAAFADAGGLRGLAPLFLHADRGRRQATLLGNGLSDRLDVLGAVSVPAWLEQHENRWDACDFRDLPEDSPLLAAPAPSGWRDLIEPDEPSPALSLPATVEDLAAGLSRRLRGNLATAGRRAERLGEVRVETADARSLERLFAILLSLHAARWGRDGAAGLADPAVQAFLREAAAGFLLAGWLRLYVLEVGGRPAAAHFGFHVRGRAYFYIGGFDPALAEVSPGALLLRHAIEQAVREGCESFEFLRGREAYKYAWGALDRPQFRRRITRD